VATKTTTPKHTELEKRQACPYVKWKGHIFPRLFCQLSESPCTELPESCKEFHARKSGTIVCDLCPNPAVWFESPLFNPDEPKLCDNCFKTKMQFGARDYLAEAHWKRGEP
jgi:hypothetical protein